MDDDSARGSARDRSAVARGAARPTFDDWTAVPERARAASGTVYLVGAGPGDPDLLTVRAHRLLETADVVFHDALTRETLVDRIPRSVDAVDVGKRAERRTPQSEINALLVERASDGDAVVRLKGDDRFVFGRGGEEAKHLAERGVAFEVVPGVSSVIAALGLAGIPLTHRGISSRFTVITGHETPEKDGRSLDWAAIADEIASGATLVVLTGDPNHSGHQFLGKVERAVEAPVTVVPGISSLQMAASRARTPMEDAAVVTLHRSGDLGPALDHLADAAGDRHLLVLPRPFDWMPGDVAELLVDSGADPALDALVLERLTHPDERVTRTSLGDLRESAGGSDRGSTPYSDLSVLVERAGGA
jgi:uroporphyrin-III C-methyltransferase